MDPQIVSKDAFTVAGCMYRGDNQHGEIPQMWDRDFIPRVGELGPSDGTLYGAMRMVQDGAPGEFEYLACGAVAAGAPVPEGMVAWDIPAQTYAVVPADDVPDLCRAFDDLYSKWAPQSAEYEPSDGPCLEVYPPSYPDDHIIHVYAPVRPRGAASPGR